MKLGAIKSAVQWAKGVADKQGDTITWQQALYIGLHAAYLYDFAEKRYDLSKLDSADIRQGIKDRFPSFFDMAAKAKFRYWILARKGLSFDEISDAAEEMYYQGCYFEEIRSWDWDGIKSDAEEYGSCFVGTIAFLTPSGCFYTPWANGNVTEDEASLDEMWWDALETVAEEHGLSPGCGEDDPCDIFVFGPSND